MTSNIDTTLRLKITQQHEIRQDLVNEIIQIAVREKLSVGELYNTLNDVLEEVIQEKPIS